MISAGKTNEKLGKNLAYKKYANQSTIIPRHQQLGYGLPAYAVDGKRNANYISKSCTHTYAESDPWWFVDLGGRYIIKKVIITNRDGYRCRKCGKKDVEFPT